MSKEKLEKLKELLKEYIEHDKQLDKEAKAVDRYREMAFPMTYCHECGGAEDLLRHLDKDIAEAK